ncbi:MAG TPA: hypothetical protein VM120_14940 [Bryobacteraceae bacterium]|nr:hypothetical protein [Bryobacteraceae bacterium]
MSNHLDEDQLVLHYYGEQRDGNAEGHLSVCEHCRDHYRILQRVLNAVNSYSVPERGPEYHVELWRKLEHRLPLRARTPRLIGWLFGPKQWITAAAMSLLLAGAFYAGRISIQQKPREMAAVSGANEGFDERVLLSAVGNHLERSQLVLVELANSADLQSQQEDVRDLIDANRLFRTSAAQAGEGGVAEVLDELERLLLEVAHLAPSLSPEAAQELRERIRNKGVLFRVKVTESEVRERL